jgi:small GTP-binding protein
MKKLTIGLIGNPNSGKTTLFNQLTGSRQRVGNWAGVTVERKEGQFSTTDHQVTLVDLPGTYSLTTISSQTSLDEQIACHYILSGDADLLINVVDASNLERNLYLTLQLLELGIPCIVALNMLDIAEKQNIRIEIDALSARLGCPVIPLVSTRGRGIEALKLAIDRYKANENVELVHYAQPLLNEADSLAKVMPSDIPLKQRRWLGLQMLEGDIYSRAYAGEASQHLDAALARLRNEMDDPALHIADARYQCIAAICDVVSNTLTAEPSRFTTAVDKIVLNRFLGLPIFLFVMYLIIQTWQRLKGFVLRAGKVIIIVSIFLSAFNSFSLSGKIVDNINDSALASVSRVITPVFKPIGVHEDNWQATVGLFTGAMAKEVVVGTLNTLYTAENIQDEEFNPAEFNLGEELFSAIDETWQSLKDTFSLSVLMNPIEASKGDGEMGTGAMGVMDQTFTRCIKRTCTHYRRYVTTETDDQRHKGFPRQAQRLHQTVHHKRRTRHIPGVLKEGEEQVHHANLRHQWQHGVNAATQALGEEDSQPVREVERVANPLNTMHK